MRKVVCGLCCLLAGAMVHAEIFKWVDAKGRVHYSDQPAGQVAAEPVTLKSANSYTHVSIDDIFPGMEETGAIAKTPKVVMYMAPWCSVCKHARAWLQAEGIAFVERDIESSQSARSQWEKLGGQGVPLFTVGRKKISGFSAEAFAAVYASQLPR